MHQVPKLERMSDSIRMEARLIAVTFLVTAISLERQTGAKQR